MTKDQAVEACVKAMLRRKGYNESHWLDCPHERDLAEDLVVSLEALGLLKTTPP